MRMKIEAGSSISSFRLCMGPSYSSFDIIPLSGDVAQGPDCTLASLDAD